MSLDKLVDSTQLDSDLTSVANAIRGKTGGSVTLTFPADFVSAINGIPAGASLETGSQTITATESAQSITMTPSPGYDGFDEVDITVNAIPSNYVGSGVTQRTSSDLSASGATVTAPAGYYASSASTAVASGTEGTPTASKGAVNNHAIAVTPSVTNTAGYISGGTKTGTAVTVSASELVSGTYSVTGSGTADVTNYASISVPSGSASTPATSVTATPTISVSNTGLITASVSTTKSVTPSVSAGYVSSGTAGTVTVSGSNTQQLTAQAAQTITPTTTDQTIASGKYLTGTQTIKGDANLVAANIADGVTIFGVTGTHQGGGGGGATEYVVQPSQHPVMGFWGYDLSSVGLSASDFARDAHTKIWIEATSNISVTVWLDAYQDDDFTVTIPAGTIFECVSSDDLTYMLTSRFAFSCGANAPYGFFNASADKSEDFVQVDTGGDDPSLGCFVQTTGYKRQNGCPFLGWGGLAELSTLHILKY